MALDTFTPAKAPSRDSGRLSVVSRERIAGFGDGYEQRAADGINWQKRQIPLVWAYLSIAQADAICTFFDGKGRVAPFLYTLPWEGSARQWRISGQSGSPLYVRDKSRGLTDRIEVTLEENFDQT